jgi:hypothetical protein
MATSTPRTNRIDRALMTNLLRSLRLTGREDTTKPMVQRPDRPETGTPRTASGVCQRRYFVWAYGSCLDKRIRARRSPVLAS